MAGIAGVFVWGTDTWHVTVNGDAAWAGDHVYRLSVRCDGPYHMVKRTVAGAASPSDEPPAPPEGSPPVASLRQWTGTVKTGSVDYEFLVQNPSTYFEVTAELDVDGSGTFKQTPDLLFLRASKVHPPTNPVAFGVPAGSSGPLIPNSNFRIGYLEVRASRRVAVWTTDVVTLETP